MSRRKPQPQIIRCYPVPADQLGDAIAGRLLPANASKGDRGTAAWLYRDGFAAGIRWSRELATPENLRQLKAESGAPDLVVVPWLHGFIDGALNGEHGETAATGKAA